MRYRWDKKYLYWGITALTVIFISLCFYYFLFHGVKVHDGFFRIIGIAMPIIYGFIIAYLLTPIVNTLEHRLFEPLLKKVKIKESVKVKKRVRFVSILISIFFVFLFFYGIFSMILPQIVKSIQSITLQLPIYLTKFTEWLNSIAEDNPSIQNYLDDNNITFDTAQIIDWFNQNVSPNIENLGNIVSTLYNSIFSVMKSLFQFIIGIIVSVYLIGSKELFAGQAKKIVYAVCEVKVANQFIHNMRFVHKTFIGFLSGKIIDSFIIGCICFVGTSMMNTPYAILISVIIGITNIIPYFGPYLGAIPSAFLILMISPIQCLYFIIFILILQQIDGNIIGPKILGDSTGLSSFWVIFAITIFGGMFGVLGMFIGVPVFAVIFAAFKTLFNRMLKKKGLPISTVNYLDVSEIKNQHFLSNAPVIKVKNHTTLEKMKSSLNTEPSTVSDDSMKSTSDEVKNIDLDALSITIDIETNSSDLNLVAEPESKDSKLDSDDIIR